MQPPVVGYASCVGCIAEAGHMLLVLEFRKATVAPLGTVRAEGL